MSYRVCKFKHEAILQWGVAEGENITPVRAASIHDFIGKKITDFSPAGPEIHYGSVSFESPFSHPCQVVCQGKNYSEHIREAGMDPADKNYNLFFLKAASSLSGARGDVVRPSHVRLLDYEVELALVLKKDIDKQERITRENLYDYVAGITLANDISARDIQIPQGQWFKGKSYRTFCPVGPYVCILDESDFGALSGVRLTLRVNGELRQETLVGDMIFSPEETLTELSGLMDLRSGDLVLTGTPSGVALKAPGGWQKRIASLLFSEKKLMQMFVEKQLKIPQYLKDGDVIEANLVSPDGRIDSGKMQLTVVTR